MYQWTKCKAGLVTPGNRVLRNRRPDHTHTDNEATALARKAVGEMEQCVYDVNNIH